MIQYRQLKRLKDRKQSWEYRWMPAPDYIEPCGLDFTTYEIKIFDTVYNECTENYKQQFKDARLWEILSG